MEDGKFFCSTAVFERSYALAQYWNPNLQGRSLIQFKIGLMCVCVIKQAKRGDVTMDRNQDFLILQKFYKLYREKNNVEKLRKEEIKLRETGSVSGNLEELERKTSIRKKVSATLRILEKILEQMEETPEEKTSQVEEHGTCIIGKAFQVEELWERLVHAALKRERMGTDAYRRHCRVTVGEVRSPFANKRVINKILEAADEIRDENFVAYRILCEQCYSLAQNLDSDSEGKGVIQFKAGMMSVLAQKLNRRNATETIDRSKDFVLLQQFYKHYREKNNIEKLLDGKMKLTECSTYGDNRKESEMRRVFATLKVLLTVLELQSKEDDTQEIPHELKWVMESDAARIKELDDCDMSL